MQRGPGAPTGSILSGEETAYLKGNEEMNLLVGAKRILALDNDELMRIAMRFMLERAGYKVDLAEQGDEAINRYREALSLGRPFDAVILDWNIRGGGSARETMEKLLELDPHAKAVVMGCDRDDPAMSDFREYGFRSALIKPFTNDQLEQAVQAAVYEPRHMKNILLVDDNLYFLTGLSMNLCVYLKNCNILTAGNGRQALEIMGSIPVDLIVTDLEMPFMDGYELVESVKKKHPHLPIFATTGNSVPEAEKRITALGASHCLEKPFGFKELADMVAVELSALASVAA